MKDIIQHPNNESMLNFAKFVGVKTRVMNLTYPDRLEEVLVIDEEKFTNIQKFKRFIYRIFVK